MARTFYGLEDTIGPGTLVYESFCPQNPGIVRKVLSDTMKGRHTRDILVKVEWRKKTPKRDKITICNVMHLHSFDALIEEHKRKFENQSEMADELRNMK
jgi:hypothetical protein